jgi:hypothetical protein
MDRDELAEKRGKTGYANTAEVSSSDAPVLPSATGRDDNMGGDPASAMAAEIDQPIGATPRSAVTGHHDPGMGADETVDGLSDSEEMLRQAAEDETEVDDFEELPVFDRADAIPKIL